MNRGWTILVLAILVLLFLFTAIILYYLIPTQRIWTIWMLVLASGIQIIVIAAGLLLVIDEPEFCRFESTRQLGVYIPTSE